MWRNYLTIGFRALAKNRTYAFINIAGLAIGIAACLMILLYVRYETRYDDWLPGAERTYQFQDLYSPTETGGEEYRLQMTSYVSGRALAEEFPEVERAVYINGGGGYVLQDGEATLTNDLRFTDGNFLEVVELPMVRGNRATALQRPGQLVISESEAQRRFGSANPVGRTLTIAQQGNQNVDYQVTGVFRDIPPNSHMSFNIIARMDPQQFYAQNLRFLTSWSSQGGWYYVKLRPGASAEAINARLPDWERRRIPDDVTEGRRENPGDNQDWRLMNVRDVHLGDAQEASMTPGNDRKTVYTFAIIALLILGMACVNFTNLATARASQRAREVALRKVLGANRKQLITQFLGESILVATIATVIAMALCELALPWFNTFLGANMEISYFGEDDILLPVVVLILLVGAAGGLYPAFYLSRFQPAQILKANKSSAEAQGSGQLRNILVVAQFAVSIGLIICTAIIYAQTMFARTVDAGYRRDGLYQVQMIGGARLEQVVDTLIRELSALPGVTAVGRSSIGVAPGNNSVTSVQVPGQPNVVDLGTYGVDPQFFQAMGMRVVAGRNFDERLARDDATTPAPVDLEAERAIVARGVNVIVTEEAARRMGYPSAQAALGQNIRAGLTVEEVGGMVPSTIVGVVNDARFRSMRDPLQPILYYFQRDRFNYLVIRFGGADGGRIGRQVEEVWKRIVPDIPFRGQYADELVREMYEGDEARAQLFGIFAGLSVIIACLGLFGLAAFTAERRTKEIGIRKVLGARTRDIIRLLAWQFSKPVIIANVIAWPVAWYVMDGWLKGFDSRIPLGLTPFLLAGALALGIALVTIAAHAMKVARANPIHALRYE
ncbi:MAG TPA: ABC transporter permease [Allosphingosinicella sp.]|nr:ABC transporter permease [Allosphingosinicella sp.]